MARTLRQQIMDLTGVSDKGGLDALVTIMHDETPACVIAQMDPPQLRDLIHRVVDIWASRGWPREQNNAGED
jgi:hypothetical protein